MIERILVGTDGSEVADHAVAQAVRLASQTDAQLRILHAIERPSLYASAPEMDPRLVQRREDAGKEILHEARQRPASMEIPTSTVLRDGSAAALLEEEASAWGADLVVVGSHGRGPVQRAILGSVSDALVRRCPIPVLTVGQAGEADPSAALERLVVPSDGSDDALAAAPCAIELAEQTGASLDLVFAIPPELEGGKYLDRPGHEVDELHDRLIDKALDPLAQRCAEAGVDHERFVHHRPPHEAIVEHAADRGADLIVMATRGRGRLERFLIGSTADKVLRTARTPLVTVHPEV